MEANAKAEECGPESVQSHNQVNSKVPKASQGRCVELSFGKERQMEFGKCWRQFHAWGQPRRRETGDLQMIGGGGERGQMSPKYWCWDNRGEWIANFDPCCVFSKEHQVGQSKCSMVDRIDLWSYQRGSSYVLISQAVMIRNEGSDTKGSKIMEACKSQDKKFVLVHEYALEGTREM